MRTFSSTCYQREKKKILLMLKLNLGKMELIEKKGILQSAFKRVLRP